MICNLFPAPTYLFYSPDVPALLYYAMVPATIMALFLGFYIFFNDKKNIINKIIFILTILFFLWVLLALITWTSINSSLIIFIWSIFSLILGLISIFSIYFIYVFLNKKDVTIKLKTLFLVLVLPFIILGATKLNLAGFNITYCDAFDFEWRPLQTYSSILGLVAMFWILVILIKKYRTSLKSIKKQMLIMGIGMELFLFSFFGMEYVSTYFVKIGLFSDSSLELYGLSGMVIFIVYISILIVRYGAFHIKLLATQALIWGLILLIGSQFFFIKTNINFILNGITFILILIMGRFLVRSVKKEVKQRERLEEISKQLEASKLRLEESNLKLEDANEKLKGLDKLKTEFLSLASHQLRSPLTAIKGYASMVLEGDYGEVNDKAKETIGRILESSNNLTKIVEDLLNVSKIEQGGMKYEMNKFDFGEVVIKTAEDLSITAENKKLKLICNVEKSKKYLVNGDKEKLRQVVINFIDNSIKYTKKGKIVVNIESMKNKLILSIKDTGVGITPEIKDTLFQKFARGEGEKMNTGGSGLGLYLAKEIVEAHHGRVWIESEGKDKGSTFFVELDLIN